MFKITNKSPSPLKNIQRKIINVTSFLGQRNTHCSYFSAISSMKSSITETSPYHLWWLSYKTLNYEVMKELNVAP